MHAPSQDAANRGATSTEFLAGRGASAPEARQPLQVTRIELREAEVLRPWAAGRQDRPVLIKLMDPRWYVPAVRTAASPAVITGAALLFAFGLVSQILAAPQAGVAARLPCLLASLHRWLVSSG